MDNSNPYAAPRSVEPPVEKPAAQTFGGSAPPFESGHTRATVSVLLLGANVLLYVLLIGSTYSQVLLLQRAAAGNVITTDEASANDARQLFLGIAELGLQLITGIAFLMWLHRVYRNLPSLRATKVSYSPGWAVGYFFIPILNLFRPYQVLREVWEQSDPTALSRKISLSGALVGWWWAAWIARILAGRGSSVLERGDDISSLIAASWGTIACSAVSIAAAVLAILMVRTIDRFQTRRFELLVQTPADEVLPFARFAEPI